MAKQSLFSKSNEAPATSTLPAVPMGGGFNEVAPPEKTASGAYVAFARKDKLAELRAEVPGLQDGDAVILSDGAPRRLAPLSVMLLDVYQFWCIKGGESENYAPVRVVESRPEDREDSHGKRWCEMLSLLAFVFEPGRITPATIRVADGMARGFYEGVVAVREAATEEWFRRSAAHAATSQIPHPQMRFTLDVTWRAKKGKNGYTYFTSSGKVTPTSKNIADALKAAMERPEFPEDLETVRENFERYREDMKALIE